VSEASDDEELRMVLQRLVRRIRANRGDESIGDTQMGVLFLLDKTGDSTPGKLAEHERVSPPSMNRTLNGLERAGYITRSPSPDDARKVIVALTAEGVNLIRETRRLRTAWFSRRLAELDAGERAALEGAIPVLRRIADL